jgi:hypothetical protein
VKSVKIVNKKNMMMTEIEEIYIEYQIRKARRLKLVKIALKLDNKSDNEKIKRILSIHNSFNRIINFLF